MSTLKQPNFRKKKHTVVKQVGKPPITTPPPPKPTETEIKKIIIESRSLPQSKVIVDTIAKQLKKKNHKIKVASFFFQYNKSPFRRQFFFLQLTRWRGPGQTWSVRGNIFRRTDRSESLRPHPTCFSFYLFCAPPPTLPFSVLQAIIINHHTLTQSACAGNNQILEVEVCNATNG